jgi:hypothetical protein
VRESADGYGRDLHRQGLGPIPLGPSLVRREAAEGVSGTCEAFVPPAQAKRSTLLCPRSSLGSERRSKDRPVFIYVPGQCHLAFSERY